MNFLVFFIIKPYRFIFQKWGGISDSNRCIMEPQSTVLTPSPIPPCERHIYFINKYIFFQVVF